MSVPQDVIGNGPLRVIALHGWFGCAAAGWGGYRDLVDGERYSVAFLDYRGYGDRKDDPGPYTIEQIAADTLELADDLGWDTFALIGHSMGSVAIQKVYQLAPQRVTAMIGIAPVHCTPFPWNDDSWKLFDDAAQADGNRFGIIDFTTGNRNTPTWVNKMVAASLANSTREAFGSYLAPWGKADFAADLPDPGQAKVSLIVGAHDPALSAEFVKNTWLVTYPQASLDVVENAGHYPMFEAPVNFTTLVEKALDAI
jgi:pimeloyl-ACP methyl ester carboxylesterase